MLLRAERRRRPRALRPGSRRRGRARCASTSSGTPTSGAAFDRLPGADDAATRCRSTPGWSSRSTRSSALHGVAVDAQRRARCSSALRAEHDEAAAAVRRSRATAGEPLAEVAAVLGGELQPFQWAGVRYALDARRAFLADEQGLGKTVEALAALEADERLPGGRRLPGVAQAQLAARGRSAGCPTAASRSSRAGSRCRRPATITILNYEIVAAHREALARAAPARARRRRVALRQEPAGQAHAGRAPAGRGGRRRTACAWR